MDKEAAKKLGQQLIAAGRELIEQNSDELDRFEEEYDIPNFYKHWRWKAYKTDKTDVNSWWFKGQPTDPPSRKLCDSLAAPSLSQTLQLLFNRSMKQRHNAHVMLSGSQALHLMMSEEDAIKFAKLLPELQNRSEVQQLQAALDVLEAEMNT